MNNRIKYLYMCKNNKGYFEINNLNGEKMFLL